MLFFLLLLFAFSLLSFWFFGSRLISRYNSLVQVRENVDQTWSNIDVVLKQRNSELQKLIDTVSAFREHEKEILREITEARQESLQAASPKAQAEADAHIRQGLDRLFAVAEDYPELKSSENFQQLQERISELEERISDRRELYNEAVSIFNARIKQIPDVLFARALEYSEHEMFEAEGLSEDVDVGAALSSSD